MLDNSNKESGIRTRGSEHIAVDIALIPEKPVTDLAESANASLDDRSLPLLVEEGVWPHVTLTMAVIKRADLSRLKSSLERIKGELRCGTQKFSNSYTMALEDGRSICGWNLIPNQALKEMHESLHSILMPFADFRNEIQVLDSYQDADHLTLDFIRDFPTNSCGDLYQPHITLGFGQSTHYIPRVEFRIEFIGLFQLGNYCTCRSLLWRNDL